MMRKRFIFILVLFVVTTCACLGNHNYFYYLYEPVFIEAEISGDVSQLSSLNFLCNIKNPEGEEFKFNVNSSDIYGFNKLPGSTNISILIHGDRQLNAPSYFTMTGKYEFVMNEETNFVTIVDATATSSNVLPLISRDLLFKLTLLNGAASIRDDLTSVCEELVSSPDTESPYVSYAQLYMAQKELYKPFKNPAAYEGKPMPDFSGVIQTFESLDIPNSLLRANYLYHLALAYNYAKRSDDAKEVLEMLVQEYPVSPWSQDVSRSLK